MLLGLIFVPLIGGIIGWLCHMLIQHSFTREYQCGEGAISVKQKIKTELCNYSALWIAFISMLMTLSIIVVLIVQAFIANKNGNEWVYSIDYNWIPLLGIHFKLMLDGLSSLMCLLTILTALIAILYSRKEKPNNIGLFYFCLLFMVSAVNIFYVAKDLFLLFFIWEAVAIPFYFLITLWGRRHNHSQLRFNGANKFLLYTQVTSLLMLVSIISLVIMNWTLTNHWTFDYYLLIKTPISIYAEFFLMLGFLCAFIVRLPLVPFHGWFIDAHIESTTTSSIMISGLLVNTAIYGMLQFILPMFPNATLSIMYFISSLSLGSLLYAALLVFNQNDIKKLIAYIHIALVGFITTAIYSVSQLSYQGVVIQIIAVSLAIIGLFIVSGLLVERYLTRNITKFTELKWQVKYLSTLILFFVLVILGAPGSANFVGHFMILFGSFSVFPYITVFLIIGLLFLSVATIIRIQPIFYRHKKGVQLQNKKAISVMDFSLLLFLSLIIMIVGLYPKFILDVSHSSIDKIYNIIHHVHLDLIKGGEVLL